MNRTPALPWSAIDLPDGRLVADFAYVVYFTALLIAPIVAPPVLTQTTHIGYVPTLLTVLPAVGVAYVTGLALLLRPRRRAD